MTTDLSVKPEVGDTVWLDFKYGSKPVQAKIEFVLNDRFAFTEVGDPSATLEVGHVSLIATPERIKELQALHLKNILQSHLKVGLPLPVLEAIITLIGAETEEGEVA